MGSDDLFEDQRRLASEAVVRAFYDQVTGLRAQFTEQFSDLRDEADRISKSMTTHMIQLTKEMKLLKDTSYEQLIESRISNSRLGKNTFPSSVIFIITLVYGIAFVGFVFGKRDIELGAPGGWHFKSTTIKE